MVDKNVSPDELYSLSREDLLLYEDARLNSLLQGVANYYTTRNDQSLWGNFLRALAQELARLDFTYSYDIVNKNPSYLTPPDIRRRWANSLYIGSNWPSKTQFDIDFKIMLIELIAAYRQGSTVQAIQGVINAYTGINLVVEELYKQIGNGVYNQSDRNAIRVSVNVSNSLSNVATATLTQLQQIVASLYNAIDLAKPAHVGLEFTAVFGEDDNIDCFINPSYLTLQQYEVVTTAQQSLYPSSLLLDGSRIKYVLINPPIFWKASTPNSNPYDLNTLLRDRNGNLQLAGTHGKPGTSEPVWSTTSGGVTVDGEISWKNISPVDTLNYSLPNGTRAIRSEGGISGFDYAELSDVFKSLYQPQYQNLKCNLLNATDINSSVSGIDDILRIFVKQIEQPPQTPMLIQGPVQNRLFLPSSPPDSSQKLMPISNINPNDPPAASIVPSNPTTTITSWGWKMRPTLTPAQYDALPSITFNIVNTVADGTNTGFTFTGLIGAPGVSVYLHDDMRVTITGNKLETKAVSSVITVPNFNSDIGVSYASGGTPFIKITNDSIPLIVGTYRIDKKGNYTFAGADIGVDIVINYIYNIVTGRINNVVMNTDGSGMFEMPLVKSSVSPNAGSATPHLQDAYVRQGGQYVLLDDSSSLEPISPDPMIFPPPTLMPPISWIQIIDKVSNMPTGEVANWDITQPSGLVGPRLNQAWEIRDDQDYVFGMS